jgi:hypothetical protein
MPYVVDGNNLLGLLSGKPRPSEEERRRLLRRISERLRGMRASMLVVFDGPSETGRPESALGSLTIRYSGRRSADDVIVEVAARSGAPADQLVVTDDRGLAARARDAGAKVLPAGSFLELISRPPAPGTKPEPVDVDEWVDFFSDERNRLP